MTDCAPGNYLSMVDNSDVGLSYYRGKCSLTPHSLEDKMGEIRKPKDTVSMENKLGIEHPPESSKPPCSLLQHSWEQKMGEILRSKDTASMETKHSVESPPDPPKPHSCLLNGQVSTLTCPPVVPHQEACGLPDQKSLAKHITHLKRAKLRHPILKLHRLQAKDFRRFRDLARVGINKESARRLRKQLQKFRRNERRRNMRKVDKSLLNGSKLSAKKVDLCSEDFVKSEGVEKTVFRSSLKPRKKLPRPTANGSITDADVKDKSAKKGRQPRFDAYPSPNSADMRVHSALNLPRPTVLPFQPHAAAVPPSMMSLPWISPATSLFSHSPYVPCPPATPLILPSRDLLASSLRKVPRSPPMIPLDKIQAPVFAMPQCGKETTPDLETQLGKLPSITPVVVKHENFVSSPSYVPHLGRLPVSSHGVVPQQGKIPALSSLTPKLENPPAPPSMTHHPSYSVESGKMLSSAKAPHSEKMSIPSSVACRPPPLIPLPLSRENLGIYNTKYSDTSDVLRDVISSKMTQRQSQKEMAVPDPSKISSQISVTSHYPSNAEFHHESFAHREADKAFVQIKRDPSHAESASSQRNSNTSHMPSVSSHMSSVIPQAVTTTSQDSLILSVPKILPKVSAPSVGLTISPMVLIPASVAFESLNSQMVTNTSQMTAKASHVRPKIQASIPVSSVTSGVPPQYYWIVTPKLSTPSTTVSAASPVDSSQKSVIDHSLSRTATSAIRTISQSPAMTSALPASLSSSQHSIIGPPPVSSSSYLASLLKAGVPLVPVSSTVDSVISTLSSGLPTSSVSTTNVSGASLPVTISVSKPIMSTPPIIAHQKNLSPRDSGEDYKPSHVGHKGVEKQAHIVTSAAKSPPTLNSQPTDPVSVPSTRAQAAVTGADDSAPKKTQTALNVVPTSATPTFHIPETVTTDEDSVRINDIITAILGETSAVRLIMESVSSAQKKVAGSTSEQQRKLSTKQDSSQEPSSGHLKLKVKKQGPSRRKSHSQMKHQGESSSGIPSHPTPPKRIPKEKSLERDLRTQQDNVEDRKCSEKELSISTIPVTSRSVITSVSKWKNDSGVSSSSCGSKHQVENFTIETLAKPAKVDFVPVISCVEQKQLFTPQLASGTETAAADDNADERRQAESVAGSVNTSAAEKQVRSSPIPGSDGVLKKTASVPKTLKKKRTNVEGIKVPCKRKHQSGKTSGTKKRISDVVESLRKEKERPVSVLRNVDLNNGSGVVRSTIICKVESSHGKNSVISPSPAPAVESSCSQISAISSSALGGKPSHNKNTAIISSNALAKESPFGTNITNTSSSAPVAEPAHNNRIVKTFPTSLASQEGEASSASLTTNHMVESSLTQKYSTKVCKRDCRKRLLLKLERLTHRHIKRDFLKKHRISMRSGILLRRQLRNWDIKRYLSLYGKKPPLLPSESSSQPSPEPSDEKETRHPKIDTDGIKSVALQDMLQEAHTGVESGFWPPQPDILVPSTSTAAQPQKRKARKLPLPRLRFMGEHSEALSSKGSSQAARLVCDRSSDQTSPGIISCNKQQLLVLKNERLSLGQVNFLSLIGSGLAKKASNNSDLDSIPGSQIMMDPGFFGLKGTSRPPPSWSLVLDAQGSKIESSTNMAPTPSQSHTPREISGIQGPSHHSKVLQPGQVHSAALPSSQAYTSTSLPLGQVYATAFMTPGQQIQSGQGQYHVITPIPSGRDGNAQGHAPSVIHQRRIFAPTVIPPSHQPSSAGLPSASAVQAPNSPMGTRILTVDHAGRVRDTLSQSIPAAYSRYSASASRPDSWNNQRPSARASPPPPLTFMGVGGVNSSMRDAIPSTKAPRGMPPPLSFMGSSSETSTRPLIHISSSQSSPRPSNAAIWTRALDLSQQGSASRTYGVINHTRHVIPEKLPLNMPYPAHGNVGLEQRPSGLPYGTQVHVLDHHPSSISNAMQTHGIPNQQPFKVSHTNQAQVIHDHRQPGLPYNVQGKLLNHHMSNTPQETHERVTGNQQQQNLPHNVLHQNDVNQRPSSHPQDDLRLAALNKRPPSLPLNAQGQVKLNKRPSSVPHDVQGRITPNQQQPKLTYSVQDQVVTDQHIPSVPSSVQGSPASSLQTPASSLVGTPDSSHSSSPADSGASGQGCKVGHESELHHHHKSRIPELMPVIEALILQLIDIGLPTSLESITQTVIQLFEARGTFDPFCCKPEAKKWYQDFCMAHAHRLPRGDGEEAWPLPSDDEARQWLTKLKVDMIKFYGVTPLRVFYMQELNFFLDKQTREIKFHRMFPGKVHCSNEKDTVTVLFILGANGHLGPGMIIFPRMVIPEKLFSSLKNTKGGKEWVLGSSMNGWLYSDCISEFVSDVFVPWLKKRNVHFPVALFTNEYVSNIPLTRMSESFMNQGIQLITVPRVMAPVLSPAEWIIADYFRTKWGQSVHKWRIANNLKPLLEENFPPFIISCLINQATPEQVRGKFVKFGICPFDCQAMFQCLRSRSYKH